MDIRDQKLSIKRKKIMKKLIFTIGIIIIAQNIALGQCAVRQFSTQPTNAKNADFIATAPSINPFLNQFNWGSNDGNTFLPIELNSTAGWYGRSAYLMNSPFGPIMPSDYHYLSNGGVGDPNSRDWHWENGWELMYMDLGFFPSGESIGTSNSQRIVLPNVNTLANPKVPYFILYNRYNRTLRIFANLVEHGWNNVNHFKVEMAYLENYSPGSTHKISGIFRNVGGFDRPLDQKTAVYQAISYNRNINNINAWISADFKLAYDPCVCQFASSFFFEFKAFTSLNVDLVGRSVSLNLPLADANGNPKYTDFLNISNENGNQTSLVYKSMESLFADYTTKQDIYKNNLAEYNTTQSQVIRILVPLVKDAVVTGITAGLGSALGGDPALNSFLIKNSLTKDSTSGKKLIDLGKDFLKEQLGKQYDNLGVQFFSAALNKPQSPTMPTATFTETKIKGKITGNSAYTISALITPGSYKHLPTPSHQLAYNTYPIHNKPTGLFALLETPSLKAYLKSELVEELNDHVITNNNGDLTWKLDKYVANKQFEYGIKLDNDLVYSLNEHVDINYPKSKKYGAIQLELTSNDLRTLALAVGSEIISKIGNFTLTHSIEDSRKIGNISIPSAQKVDTFIYTSEFYSLEELRNIQFSFILKHPFAYWDNSGNQCPSNAPHLFEDRLSNFTEADRKRRWHGIISGNGCAPFFNEGMDIDILRVKFKIATDFYFLQNDFENNEINTFEVYSYLLKDKTKFHFTTIFDDINYTNTKSDVIKYRTGITRLFDQHITISSPFVDEVIGNNLYLKAERVDIQGFLTVEPGYNYFVQATSSINIVPNSYVSQTVQLEIKNFFNSPKIEAASQSYLSTYCQTKYKANVVAMPAPLQAGLQDTGSVAEIKPSLDTLQKSTELQKSNFYVLINPNPVIDIARLNIYSEMNQGIFDMTLFSSNGLKLMENKFDIKDGVSFEINMSHLPNGIYNFLIQHLNETKNIKIQVIH